jgi:hypothetical protein
MLYFDIEWYTKGDSPDRKAQERINCLKETIHESLCSIGLERDFETTIEDLSRIDEKKKGVFKNSFHLFYPNVYFENNKLIGSFVKFILKLDKPLLLISKGDDDFHVNLDKKKTADKTAEVGILDKGIYTSHRPFRLPGSHKYGSSQRLQLPSEAEFKKMVTVGKACPKGAQYVTHDMVDKALPSDMMAHMKQKKSRSRQHVPNKLMDDYRDPLCKRIKELLIANGDEDTHVSVQNGRLYGMNHPVNGRKCLIAPSQDKHHSNNCFFTIGRDEKRSVWYHCYSSRGHSECEKKYIGCLLEKPAENGRKEENVGSEGTNLDSEGNPMPSEGVDEIEPTPALANQQNQPVKNNEQENIAELCEKLDELPSFELKVLEDVLKEQKNRPKWSNLKQKISKDKKKRIDSP